MWMMPYILWAGIIGDIGLLGYYKYFNFVIVNLNQFFGLTIPAQQIILPLGISFFTFTQIAFIVDTYRGSVERINPLSYIQFVTFFPHLIAGPIYHHSDIIPQFEDVTKNRPNWTNINLGVFFFFFGLAKKVIIADTLATVATPIFSAVANGGTPQLTEAWFGALAYTLQIYFDFSGYCDMAIGIALLFSIRFPINFFSPYKVTSIIDFWRCWNITLSNFLRDYLYIPLGGNRYGVPVQIRNLMITMLLGGLWHGAGWTLVIWGGLHGVYLTINHLWRKTGILLHASICWIVTLLAVIMAWVFFRADSIDSAIKILKGMIGWNGVSVPVSFLGFKSFIHSGLTPLSNVDPIVAGVSILAALGIALLLPNLYDMTRHYQTAIMNEKQFQITRIEPFHLSLTYRQSIKWSLITGIVAAVAIICLQKTSEFLYFQF
jgi:D-alanyl-lipoteichoic acid acyltransferase DltB (MBOAT superfamily)